MDDTSASGVSRHAQRREKTRQLQEQIREARHIELEKARKAVRAMFSNVPTQPSENFPVVQAGFLDTEIKPCRELLVLYGVREFELEQSADQAVTEGSRNEIHSKVSVSSAMVTHMLNLSVPLEWNKFELCLQRGLDGEVHIAARAKKLP